MPPEACKSKHTCLTGMVWAVFPALAAVGQWCVISVRLMSGLLIALAGSEVVMPLILSTVRSNKGKNVTDSTGLRIGCLYSEFGAVYQGVSSFQN